MSQTPPKVLTIFTDFRKIVKPFRFTYYGSIYDLETRQCLWQYCKNDLDESQFDDSVYVPMHETARNDIDASKILPDDAMSHGKVIEYKITPKNKIIITTNDNNFIEWFNDIKTHVTKNSIVPEETLERHLKNEVDLFRFLNLMANAMLNLKRYIHITSVPTSPQTEEITYKTSLYIYPKLIVPTTYRSVVRQQSQNTTINTPPLQTKRRTELKTHQTNLSQRLEHAEQTLNELIRLRNASAEKSRHTSYPKTTPPTYDKYGDEITYQGWYPGDDGPEGSP